MNRLSCAFDRFMRKMAFPFTLAYLALTFWNATQANYPYVIADALLCLCFFGYYLAQLQLDRPRAWCLSIHPTGPNELTFHWHYAIK